MEQLKINENYLKLSGKACIPQPLVLGNSYKLLIDGEITNQGQTNNHDGSADQWFKFEPILVSIQKDNGETIKAKDVRKWSQKLRNWLYRGWETNNSSLSFDDYYDKVMKYLIANSDELADRALNIKP